MAHDDTKVYALNLFDVADREEYLAYSRRSAREVARHGGRVVALGRFREGVTGQDGQPVAGISSATRTCDRISAPEAGIPTAREAFHGE